MYFVVYVFDQCRGGQFVQKQSVDFELVRFQHEIVQRNLRPDGRKEDAVENAHEIEITRLAPTLCRIFIIIKRKQMYQVDEMFFFFFIYVQQYVQYSNILLIFVCLYDGRIQIYLHNIILTFENE